LADAAHDEVESSPTYWFTLLDGALRRGDLDAASSAHERLRELGVELRFVGGLRAASRRYGTGGGGVHEMAYPGRDP
jgi:hypothetical protein